MSGVGAFKYGGRWNSPGHYVAYASAHLTLAMLELLVHVDDAEAFHAIPHSYCAITFPSDAVATLAGDDLPPGWNARPESSASQVVGDEWLESLSTPVLAVPSVVVPLELRYELPYLNYLLNPQHPAYASTVEVAESRDLVWDPRLAR